MKKTLALLAAGALASGGLAGLAATMPACSTAADSKFNSGTDGGGVDGVDAEPEDPFFVADASVEAGKVCVGLECQQVACNNGTTTSVSGTVYDPAGNLGLYNVFVYVPNGPLDPLTSGPVCTSCQAPASGLPIATTTTDAKGHFKLDNVPVGTDIPLVMQLGKWRRKISIPQVTQCVDNVQTDKNKTRLPKKQKESDPADNIPLIALATGCDQAECFFMHIGIDPSAIGAPTFADPSKRLHIYRGSDNGQDFGSGTMGDAYALWGNKATMMKYDIIFNACECSTYDRATKGPAYANMKAYIDGGGRMFGTHYHYNWFASTAQCGDSTCQGPADFNGVAQWMQSDFSFASPPYYIDTDFPKGAAFSDWMDASETLLKIPHIKGQLDLGDTRNDVKNVTLSPQKNEATRWIYTGTKGNAYKTAQSLYDTYYLSFNAPVKTTVDKQCGRAVYSDVHLSGSAPGTGAWPNYCGKQADQSHLVNEVALEFLFFDLSSCVSDDSKPPPPPPVN